ncbi:MAG: hypothetical protein R3E48_14505 [Burkholderiaceae bacterium]
MIAAIVLIKPGWASDLVGLVLIATVASQKMVPGASDDEVVAR